MATKLHVKTCYYDTKQNISNCPKENRPSEYCQTNRLPDLRGDTHSFCCGWNKNMISVSGVSLECMMDENRHALLPLWYQSSWLILFERPSKGQRALTGFSSDIGEWEKTASLRRALLGLWSRETCQNLMNIENDSCIHLLKEQMKGKESPSKGALWGILMKPVEMKPH